jgi:hypothetical protein
VGGAASDCDGEVLGSVVPPGGRPNVSFQKGYGELDGYA